MRRTRRWPGRFPFSVIHRRSPHRLGFWTAIFCLGLVSASNLLGQDFGENFDGVNPPALPAGWTSVNAEPLWVSSGVAPDTPPNDAFVNDAGHITDKRLDSPPIAIPAGGAQLTFQNTYDTEPGLDGGVLEISIAGTFFQDIVAAGGTFVSGAYNGTIDAVSDNPLAGRAAWTGNSGGYITTVVNLPTAVGGQSIQLRWRMGTNSSNGAGFTGWRIDTISIPNASFSENFDGATPPALPPGWTGGEVFWVTDSTNPDTAPNDAHADEVLYASDRRLISPSIAIPTGGTATLTFHHSYDMETDSDNPDLALDFGILEISIAGGPFQEILAAGGAFLAGPYDKSGNTVWGGTTDGVYVTTIVALPLSANGNSIQLSWRFATDNFDNGFSNDGWRIDTITLASCPPTALATAASPAICPNSSTTLQGSGGDSCAWSPATWLSDPNSCNPTVTPGGSTGTVTYTLTVTDSQCPPGSNTGTATVSVTSTPPPVAAASAFPPTICPGSFSTLTGSGGTSCFWTPATGLSDRFSCNPTASPNFTTFYTVTVGNGCGTSRATTVVTVTPHLAGPGILAPSTVLSGQPDLTASIPSPLPDATYSWTIVNGTITSAADGPSIVFTAGRIGVLTLTVTEHRGDCVSDPSSVNIDVLAACTDPAPPPSAEIRPTGNPEGPVTGIDHLDLSWTVPTPTPAFYLFALNGGATQTTNETSALDQPPTGNNEPITLSVRAACAENNFSEATEVTVSPTPPGAEFSIPASVGVGATVTFTDTSAPAATSWLWIFGDGGVARTQSAGHIYKSEGIYTVWLIASNGAGVSAANHELTVGPAGTAVARARVSSRAFESTADPVRRSLLGVSIAASGRTWLHIVSLEQIQEAIVFLRFLGQDGALVAERRLSVAPGQEAIYDLAAYGLRGDFTLELVSPRWISPSLVEPAHTRTVQRGGER